MSDKKILVIYPNNGTDRVFHLFDPETGEVLAFRYCSSRYVAKNDLHDARNDRLVKWEKKYGQKTEAKFINETDYDWEKIYETYYKRNQLNRQNLKLF